VTVRSSIAVLGIATLCSACFAPFPHDRHDLVDFRIVGVQVSDAAPEPGDTISAKALVYGGDGFYHDVLPTLEWSLGEQVAEGPLVELTVPDEDGEWELHLVATHADGLTQETAVLPLSVGLGLGPLPPPELPAIQRAVIELPLDSDAEAFTLEARQRLQGEGAFLPMADGQAARLRLPLDDPEGRYRARWMSAGGQGTFLELDATITDWVPADVFLDAEDLEAEVGEALELGLYGLGVLVIDELGSNAWAFADVNWGVELSVDSTTWVEHRGRLRGDPAAPPSGLVKSKLMRDDDSPWGVAMGGGNPWFPWEHGEPFEFAHPPCEHPLPAREPFDMDWIAEGLCSREAVIGHHVVMRVEMIETWNGTP